MIDFLVTYGDELMDDDDTDEFLEMAVSEADKKSGSQEDLPLLNTQFNIEDGKSKIVKTSKWGALSKAIMATRWDQCQRGFYSFSTTYRLGSLMRRACTSLRSN